MSRLVKAYLKNGPGISGHREHRSDAGRRKNYHAKKVAKFIREKKLRKYIREEARDEQYVE